MRKGLTFSVTLSVLYFQLSSMKPSAIKVVVGILSISNIFKLEQWLKNHLTSNKLPLTINTEYGKYVFVHCKLLLALVYNL